jgi:hypothetical protein
MQLFAVDMVALAKAILGVGFQKSACAVDLGDRYGPASRE